MTEKELNVDELVNELWDTLKALFLSLILFLPHILFYSLITVFAYDSWIYPLTAYSLGFGDVCGIFMFLSILMTIFGKPAAKTKSVKDIWQTFTGRILAVLAIYGLCNLAWMFVG